MPQTARLEAGGVPRDQPVISEFSLVQPGPCPMDALGKDMDAVERQIRKSAWIHHRICVLQIRSTEYTRRYSLPVQNTL